MICQQHECPNLNWNLEWVSNHFYKSNLTALKKQNPLVNAVTTKITKKMNLNPPALLCILTALSVSSECSSSRPAMFVIGTWAVSLGTVTATFGGPSKSFRKACNLKTQQFYHGIFMIWYWVEIEEKVWDKKVWFWYPC